MAYRRRRGRPRGKNTWTPPPADQLKWPVERVREEIRQLDEQTGLHGADLKIALGKATRSLGSFRLDRNGVPSFRFSSYFLENPKFAEQSAKDLIRHEYAHYMMYSAYGKEGLSHDARWKAAVASIGGTPTRLYSEDQNKVYLKMERKK